MDRLDETSIKALTAEEIIAEELFEKIFDELDEIKKARMLNALKTRAKELKVFTYFNTLYKAYKRVFDEIDRKYISRGQSNYTSFTGPYSPMQCLSWIATDSGIYQVNNKTGEPDSNACYHPILPIERLRNLETGEEQIKLAFKRNSKWEEIIVPKVLVSSANKIVSLASRGVAVTSENAKNLVRYLADVENTNDIIVKYSTSKLGWIGGSFIPYDTYIVFDGDIRFKQIAEAVKPTGNPEDWYRHVRELRKSSRIEARFMLAASFSSILVAPLKALPFFVDLWGETEGGKTVALMLAASVWANPDEFAYIKDYKGTEVGLESTCDLLNHLPLLLDDSSKKNRRIEENFEGLIYDLCSGKGKTRSNKEIGLNRESHWRNCIITNGERPLSSYATQGGAINRILELECGRKLFDNPGDTAEIVKSSYGHAGREFAKLIEAMDINEIKHIQQDFLKTLMSDEKMQKQSLSLSIVLTADKLIADYLFKDGRTLAIDEAKKVLIDRNELSDNERCYQHLLDSIIMNPARFDEDTENIEKWGFIEGEYAVIFGKVFGKLCEEGKFSKSSFLSWAKNKGLTVTDPGRKDKVKKVEGVCVRCVCLKIKQYDKDAGFTQVANEEQLILPFNLKVPLNSNL